MKKQDQVEGGFRHYEANYNNVHSDELVSREEKRMKKKMKKRRKDGEKREVVKVKQVYGLPGQKHDTPGERDPLRIFYEVLYQNLPDSEVAAVCMMEWGLLPPDKAMEIYKKNLSQSQEQKLWSPAKAVAAEKGSKNSAELVSEPVTGSVPKTRKRRKVNDENSPGKMIKYKLDPFPYH